MQSCYLDQTPITKPPLKNWTRTKTARLEMLSVSCALEKSNPLHHNVDIHFLHAVRFTFLVVLTRKICWIIKRFFSCCIVATLMFDSAVIM